MELQFLSLIKHSRKLLNTPNLRNKKRLQTSLIQLCKKCKNNQRRGAPKQELIDSARQLVAADDEFKAQKNEVTAFLFRYPLAKDGIKLTAGFIGGLFTYWLFLDS